MGTRIDDSLNKVTLVGTDKIPLGDGSFSPKHYTVDQMAEYAVSTASAAITSVNQVVSVLSDARTSVGQVVSVLSDARTSVNQVVSVLSDARTSIGQAVSVLQDARTSINSVLTNSVLSTAQGDARYMATAETCTLVEAYGFASVNVVSTMISVGNLVSIYSINVIRDLSAGDQNGYIAWTSTGGGILTVPACATIPFPIGCQITFRQRNTGKLGVSAAPGVSIQAPSSCSTEARGQGSTFTIIKFDSDTWDITGDLSVK